VRFNTTWVSFEKQPSGLIHSLVKDNLTNLTYTIESRFLFGCDGARSQVLQQIDIPLIKKPGQGLAINVLIKADLSHLMKARKGNLHWIMQPGEDYPDFGWTCIARMVKPWHE
jgi:2-polyprenyl-6-methoxyphenol hydroxylase-like FAD-dependent oxidoreductase